MSKGKKTETQPIKWNQAMFVLDALRDKGIDNTRLMLACGFFFGLRISDILSLTYEQISNDSFIISEKKTSKEREVHLDSKFIEIRNQIVSNLKTKPTGLIFIYNRSGANKHKAISRTAANKRIRGVFQDFEINCSNPSSHTLRKTFGLRVYNIYNRSEDALILLSQIFNHSNISITRRYIGITKQKISNAYTSLSSGKQKK